MSGRERQKKAEAPGSARRKSYVKVREQSRESVDEETPAEVKEKPEEKKEPEQKKKGREEREKNKKTEAEGKKDTEEKKRTKEKKDPDETRKVEEKKRADEKKEARGKARRDAQPRYPRPPASGEPLAAANNHPSYSTGDSNDDNPAKILQNTLEKLKIRKTQKSEATRRVNEIQEAITKHVKETLDWCKEINVLRTGSHYENLKICQSDEFDVMLAVSVERVDIQPFGEDGAFYTVALKRHQKHILDRFLNEDKTLSASKMLSEFREKVKEAADKLPDVSVDRKKQGCPAVTLQVKKGDLLISLDFVLGLEVHSQSWPNFTANGFQIDDWLGKKVKMDLKRKPYYLVCKYEGRGTREQDGVTAKDAWRISFSHVEKEVLKNHGHSKTCCETRACCRKQCLKLLKYLVKRLKETYPKEAGKLCSYHAKTTLLHACAKRVEDSNWAAKQLSDCFQQLLQDFEVYLRKHELPNFFVPSHNLLKSAGLDNKSCDLLANYIESERNNGFPLFRQTPVNLTL